MVNRVDRSLGAIQTRDLPGKLSPAHATSRLEGSGGKVAAGTQIVTNQRA